MKATLSILGMILVFLGIGFSVYHMHVSSQEEIQAFCRKFSPGKSIDRVWEEAKKHGISDFYVQNLEFNELVPRHLVNQVTHGEVSASKSAFGIGRTTCQIRFKYGTVSRSKIQ